MGHLSRSCPDNPKGLYAEGECTDSLNLEKLKLQCPSYLIQKKVTLQVNENVAKRNSCVSFSKSRVIPGNQLPNN